MIEDQHQQIEITKLKYYILNLYFVEGKLRIPLNKKIIELE